ncbi:MAG: hypothetical protein CSB55_03790 [Candidatus Cloacimonadota bacterium]|nr:MAG: hypothetical protein CSB55_03790 [Candidatus Cloacimonadota bacterium]
MKKLVLLALVVMVLGACSITIPVSATSNTVGNKVGQAMGTGYLGILNFDVDASIQTAARNGGIKKISTVDFKKTDLLGFVQTYTCIVTGE